MRIPPVMMREFLRSYCLLELIDNPRTVDALEERPLETWRAVDPVTGRIVVIRRVNITATERKPLGTAKEAKRVLEREIRMRDGIQHLSLPAILEVYLDDKQPFVVLSHHAGILATDLFSRLKRSRDVLPLPMLLSIMKDLVSALQARLKHSLHDGKQLGELWPGSVRIDWNGRALHLDSPKSKIALVEEHDLWRRVPWMSPEEAAALQYPTDEQSFFLTPRNASFASRSEVYTIALIIYALASQLQPFAPLLSDSLVGDLVDSDDNSSSSSEISSSKRASFDEFTLTNALMDEYAKKRIESEPLKQQAPERAMPLSPIPRVARRYARIAQERIRTQKLAPLHSLRADLPLRFCKLIDHCLTTEPLVRLKPIDVAHEISALSKDIAGTHADTVAAVLEVLFSDEKEMWRGQKNEIELLELGHELGIASFEGIDIP